MTLKELIKNSQELQLAATPLPWVFSSNAPFSVTMTKPARSLSKHDSKCPHYWRYEDGMYAAQAINILPLLLKLLDRQTTALVEIDTRCSRDNSIAAGAAGSALEDCDDMVREYTEAVCKT